MSITSSLPDFDILPVVLTGFNVTWTLHYCTFDSGAALIIACLSETDVQYLHIHGRYMPSYSINRCNDGFMPRSHG